MHETIVLNQANVINLIYPVWNEAICEKEGKALKTSYTM